MGDPVVFKDPEIYLGGFRLTRAHNQFAMEASFQENKDERFGDQARAFYPGVMVARASGGGFFAAGAGEIDTVVAARIGSGTAWPLSCCPVGDVDGQVAYDIEVGQYSYRFGARHGESLPFTLGHTLRDGNGLVRSTIVLPRASRVGNVTGTGRQLGALSAAQKLVAVLHVFAATGGSITFTVESDDNAGFSSATTRLTFTAASGITRQVLELSGPVTDDRWRVVGTGPGVTHEAFATLAIL